MLDEIVGDPRRVHGRDSAGPGQARAPRSGAFRIV
jgi:hypothetical protein